MPTVVQIAVGAGQFTGLAGFGLIQFADFLPGLSNDPDERPILTGVSLANANNEALTFDCFLRPFADLNTTARRKTILRPSSPQPGGFTNDGCRIFIDRQIFGAAVDIRPWSLVLITSGAKTVDASFVVSFTVGSYRRG